MTFVRPLDIGVQFGTTNVAASWDYMYERGIVRSHVQWASDALSSETRPLPIGASGIFTVSNRDGRYNFDSALGTGVLLTPHRCRISFRRPTYDATSGWLETQARAIWQGWAQLDVDGVTRGPAGQATFRLFDDIVRVGNDDYEVEYPSAGTTFAAAFNAWVASHPEITADTAASRVDLPAWSLGPFTYSGSYIQFIQNLAEMVDGYVWFDNIGRVGVATHAVLNAKNIPTRGGAAGIDTAVDSVFYGIRESPLFDGVENRITPKEQIVTTNQQSISLSRSLTNITSSLPSGVSWRQTLIYFLPDGPTAAADGTADLELGAWSARGSSGTGIAALRTTLGDTAITEGVDYLFNGRAMRYWIQSTASGVSAPTLGPAPPVLNGFVSYPNPPGADGSFGEESYVNTVSQGRYGIRESPRPDWYNNSPANLTLMNLQREVDRIGEPYRRVTVRAPLWQRNETRSRQFARSMGVGSGLIRFDDDARNWGMGKSICLAQRLDYAPRRGPPVMTYALVDLDTRVRGS